MESKRVKQLDGIRLELSILVFLCHIDYIKNDLYLNKIFQNILNNGAYEVTFFFMLSGFCVYLGYGDGFKKLSVKEYVRFIYRRISKIYPIYLLTSLGSIIFQCIFEWISVGWDIEKAWNFLWEFIFSATMTQTWIYNSAWNVGNAAGWYISSLFFLYLVTPFVLHVLHYIISNRKIITAILLASYVSVIGVTGLLYLFYLNGMPKEKAMDILYVVPLCRLPYYLCGLLGGALYSSKKELYPAKISNLIDVFNVLLFVGTYKLSINLGTKSLKQRGSG